MVIDRLVLEITRRCNMRCSHCMRGYSQRVNMSQETLCNTLKGITSIYSLTITGGEPSLRPDFIKDIYTGLLMLHIDVGYFYIVSNAHSYRRRREFLDILDSLYNYCDEKDMCSLEISQDQYHLFEHTPDMRLYEEEWFEEDTGDYYHRPYIHPDNRKRPIERPLNEGLAEHFGVGVCKREEQYPWDISFYDEELHVSGEENQVVYISANGNVTSCCDMSYRRIDEEHVGNVNKKSLKDIILGYSEMLEPSESVA